jgi:DNA polymerase-3 subunit epsilon
LILTETASLRTGGTLDVPRRQRAVPLAARVTDADRIAHRDFVATLGEKAIWKEFAGAEALKQVVSD